MHPPAGKMDEWNYRISSKDKPKPLSAVCGNPVDPIQLSNTVENFAQVVRNTAEVLGQLIQVWFHLL